MDCTEKKVWKDNYAKIQRECSLVKSEMEKQKNLLENKIDVLKQAQKADLELMNIKRNKWEEQREALREEKKKLEPPPGLSSRRSRRWRHHCRHGCRRANLGDNSRRRHHLHQIPLHRLLRRQAPHLLRRQARRQQHD
jgi:hypothetical protein